LLLLDAEARREDILMFRFWGMLVHFGEGLEMKMAGEVQAEVHRRIGETAEVIKRWFATVARYPI